VCFPLDPGVVQTELCKSTKYLIEAILKWIFADRFPTGLLTPDAHPDIIEDFKNFPPKPVDETVAGMLNVIDGSTREGEGGQFLRWDGSRMAW
jgi:hypothetical protein